MRVFLTGGTGFIGQPLTAAIRTRGWEVVALVRDPGARRARHLADLGATLAIGDVTDRESLRAGMTGADLVIHNAAWYEVGVNRAAAARMRVINVDGTEQVLGLARELGVGRIVHVSSVIAFGESGTAPRNETFERQAEPVSVYEESKTAAHAIARHHQHDGAPLIIVCPGAVIGPNDHSAYGYYARLYINGVMPPLAWARDAVYTPAWVDDIAAGIALAAERGQVGETYFLTGDPMTHGEMLAVWDSTPGGVRRRLWLPTRLMALLGGPLAPLERALGLQAFTAAETVRAGGLNYNYSHAKATRELGWTPLPPEEVWRATLAGERSLRARRRGLLARLRPHESE